MIDVFQDELLTLTEAAKECPKVCGKRPSAVTMWRWATKGRRGVKLEAVWIGRNLLTTKHALNTFFNGVVNAPATGSRLQASRVRASDVNHQRQHQIATARKRLLARGMLRAETEH